jgi:SAM-dependent methyltransferase
MNTSDRLRRFASRSVSSAQQVATAPARAVGARLLRRYPGLANRVGRWSWLWQPSASRRWHERFYRRGDDPYEFASNPYEQQKYARLLDVLEGRRFPRALEVGCAQGVFTETLLPYCDGLVAVDVSEVALRRARHRLGGRAGIRFERRTLPFDCPDGPFDLIVCADVLYYWPRATLGFGPRRLRDRLAPGGTLLLLHYLGDFGQPTNGRTVHQLAASPPPEGPALIRRYGHTWSGIGPGDAGYRLDLFVRQPSAARPTPRMSGDI